VYQDACENPVKRIKIMLQAIKRYLNRLLTSCGKIDERKKMAQTIVK
jgi:hypothetical protein